VFSRLIVRSVDGLMAARARQTPLCPFNPASYTLLRKCPPKTLQPPTSSYAPYLFQCLEQMNKILRRGWSWVCFLQLSVAVVNPPTDIPGEQTNQGPRPPALTDPEKKVKAGDSSGPLFAMYSKYAEEEDKNMTEGWTKDADGIIIFVRPLVNFMYQWGLINELNRVVYSLPSLLPSSLYQSKTSDQTPRIHPHFISENFMNFKPTRMHRAYPHHPRWPLLLRSLHRDTLFG